MHREYRGSLVSCPSSLDVVPLPTPGGRQLTLALGVDGQGHGVEAGALF
ncbi:hypothetical protein [Streptomyces sp. NPDC101115]